jgi:mono/diheme cytochrome c family protein
MKRFLTVAALFAMTVAMLAPAARADETKGSADYKAKCAMCHGPDGKGQTPMGKNLKLKDLGSSDVQNMHDSDLKTLIENGKGKMPANKGKMTDKQIEDVIQYVRTLKGK